MLANYEEIKTIRLGYNFISKQILFIRECKKYRSAR